MMSPKRTLEFYRDADRKWRWRFIAANGRILADSGQGYRHLRDAERGFESVCACGPLVGIIARRYAQ
jgi:uncharacterized protein YegP (UPF0339 family)